MSDFQMRKTCNIKTQSIIFNYGIVDKYYYTITVLDEVYKCNITSRNWK